ncbi:hypothetical protein PbJCM13498_14250 [Prolixibacter bellariivorans]|uniref:DUF4249 domain-containing protein n=1 Tax=Prolixibacter bellariivorans TaxID=314319 RepID=A0A5M4AXF6_9BACT|nr:DUF4249 domain-containing protein [Prolixibacter bellariivorans]GET32562.1 hypothetical protein PbJCM13498_14250 [Prolixibacter bellariivorans]
MKTVKTIILTSIVAFLFSACQDVIDIDLDSIEPKIVVDGALTDISDSVQIKITKSTDYFKPGNYPAVSGATVTLSDDIGNTRQLAEIKPVIYAGDWRSIEGTEYTLEVEAEGESYVGTVKMPYKVSIDSLSFEPTPEYMEFTGGYLVNCHLHDPAGVENFYRLKVSKPNGSTEKIMYVFDDAFVDGNEISTQWDNEQFFENDTVVVELQTLAESTYDYYRTLSSLFEDGMIGTANPSNPVTNLSNGALGYFGAYTVSRDTIVILP